MGIADADLSGLYLCTRKSPFGVPINAVTDGRFVEMSSPNNADPLRIAFGQPSQQNVDYQQIFCNIIHCSGRNCSYVTLNDRSHQIS